MIASEYIQLLKLENAFFRENPAATQAQQQAKINEIQQQLRWNGADPTLWDYSNGTVVANAQTGNLTTTTFDLGGNRNFFYRAAHVRIVTTVGATPTATYQIQGSTDGQNWSPAVYADYLSTGSTSTATFTITTAGTNIKYIPKGQPFRYLSDITPLG
jgi:hypothetical protein